MSIKIVEGVIIGFLLLEAKVQILVELGNGFQNMQQGRLVCLQMDILSGCGLDFIVW